MTGMQVRRRVDRRSLPATAGSGVPGRSGESPRRRCRPDRRQRLAGRQSRPARVLAAAAWSAAAMFGRATWRAGEAGFASSCPPFSSNDPRPGAHLAGAPGPGRGCASACQPAGSQPWRAAMTAASPGRGDTGVSALLRGALIAGSGAGTEAGRIGAAHRQTSARVVPRLRMRSTGSPSSRDVFAGTRHRPWDRRVVGCLHEPKQRWLPGVGPASRLSLCGGLNAVDGVLVQSRVRKIGHPISVSQSSGLVVSMDPRR
jgi:hypothetical protein